MRNTASVLPTLLLQYGWSKVIAVGLGSRGNSTRCSKFLTVEQREQGLEEKRGMVLSEVEKLGLSHLPLYFFYRSLLSCERLLLS